MLSKRRLSSTFTHVILGAFGLVFAYPVIWMVFLSLKDTREMYTRVWAPPAVAHWSNYAEAWTTGNVGLTLANTFIVTIVSVALILVICYFASYAQARMRFRGRSAIMVILVSTMLIPTQVVIVPLYTIESFLGILDTRVGLILPYVAGRLPFSIFLLTAFLRSIPPQLDESAFLDGASRALIIRRILLPLSRPGLATVIVFNSFNIWNQFFLPLILTQDPALMTVTVGLMAFSQQWGMTDFPRLFAALTIISVPIITLYAVFQKQFISGITAGALKT